MYCSVIRSEYRYPAARAPIESRLALIPFTPNPILLSIGPLTIGWYGIGYVIGLGRAAVRAPSASRLGAATTRTTSGTRCCSSARWR